MFFFFLNFFDGFSTGTSKTLNCNFLFPGDVIDDETENMLLASEFEGDGIGTGEKGRGVLRALSNPKKESSDRPGVVVLGVDCSLFSSLVLGLKARGTDDIHVGISLKGPSTAIGDRQVDSLVSVWEFTSDSISESAS